MARNHFTSGSPRLSLQGVGIGEVDEGGLLLVGRRVLVAQEQGVGRDPDHELGQVEVPVEPPARVLLTEQEHEEDGDGEKPPTAHAQAYPAPCRLICPSATREAMMPIGMIHRNRRPVESRLSGRSGYSTENVSGNAGGP